EDGIRDFHVTGVQTCALPISELSGRDPSGVGGWFRCWLLQQGLLGIRGQLLRLKRLRRFLGPRGILRALRLVPSLSEAFLQHPQIGRASCRERVSISAVSVCL